MKMCSQSAVDFVVENETSWNAVFCDDDKLRNISPIAVIWTYFFQMEFLVAYW